MNQPLDDLNDLYFFCLVVEHRGFTAAGRATGIPKSKLSRRIAELEERLGVRLLQRSTRGFGVTTAGEAFYVHCAAMVEDAQAAHESLASLRAEPSGMIRVSCPIVMAQYYVAALLPRFMSLYPKVRVAFDAIDRPVQVIEERYDIAIRARQRISDDPGLVTRTFGTTRLVPVASATYLHGKPHPTMPDALERLETISSLRDQFGREAVWHFVREGGHSASVHHEPKLFCQDLRVQLEAALQGVGVALLPEPLVQTVLRAGEVVRLLPEWSSTEEIIHAVYPTRRGMLPSVRAFLDYIAEHLPRVLGLQPLG